MRKSRGDGRNEKRDKFQVARTFQFSRLTLAPAASPLAPAKMDVRTKWRTTTFIELVVAQIVELNCIPLPADCPIVNERFKDGASK